MTSSVSIVGSTQAAPQQAQGGSLASATASATVSSASSKPQAQNPDTPISPRIVVDPLAGVITEFLTSSGTVQSQDPSATVVAYLRAGLTSNGSPKPTPDETENTKHNDTLVA